MSEDTKADEFKQKIRAEDQVDGDGGAALGGMSMDDLYGLNKPRTAAPAMPGAAPGYTGRIVSIMKDDALVDLGGKSQGIVSMMQFEEEPIVGQEYEFNVERYDEREGLVILSRKGAPAASVSWENLEVGQVVEGSQMFPQTVCPRCAKRLPASARFCRRCGSDVHGVAFPPPVPPLRPASFQSPPRMPQAMRRWHGSFAGWWVLLVVVLCGYGFLHNSRQYDDHIVPAPPAPSHHSEWHPAPADPVSPGEREENASPPVEKHHRWE